MKIDVEVSDIQVSTNWTRTNVQIRIFGKDNYIETMKSLAPNDALKLSRDLMHAAIMAGADLEGKKK